MSEVRWGILGAAKFAREFMGPALALAPGGRLVALATSDPAKAEPFRAFAPDLRVHAGDEALLADPGIDAVYIPLPNRLHVEWRLKAMRAGTHVLCEKPMAMQASEFDTLITARDAVGVLAAEAFMIVQPPQWQRGMETVTERWPAVNHCELQVAAFNCTVRESGVDACPLEFSRGTQMMMDAAFASASSLRPSE